MNPIRSCLVRAVIIAISAAAISQSPCTVTAQTCKEWAAKVVSVQGRVQARKTGETQWHAVKFKDTYCTGDRIRVLERSRADIVLANEATLRLDQNTTVTFSEPEKEKTSLLDLLKGAVYFFSRRPRSLKVVTPFVNGFVEGTEFYIRVDPDQTLLCLFQGKVVATNEAGTLSLTGGQSATAGKAQAPMLRVVISPRDAVQWTLYYPPLFFDPWPDIKGSSSDWQIKLRDSIECYMKGDLQRAFEGLARVSGNIEDPRFFVYRASLLLCVGRADEARSDIEEALRLVPGFSPGLALQSVIAIARNEKEKAIALARKAVESDPHSASARIALSYGLEASFDLKGARDSLKEAVTLEPRNSLAWARLAELWLSFGDLKEAQKAARKAADLNPDLARTQTVLGFAYLTQVKTRQAKEAFEKAIELDQADPLPRLGLGLAQIREGDLSGGRSEIEIAASLDPGNSLIRSYLGKAYYEEKRDKLAESQFTMAKKLDPSDPTPFFYDAILKQSVNEPVEALHDLQESISLNDNRAVYRSRLLLDSDLAARSASLARIYGDLGFQQLALVEGWKSLNADPGNFSAHRFLSDSYSALPRHEIARVSELLQSQLLQPLNITPLQPHLGESDLFILSGAGPSDLSFNEFTPLFNRNRLSLQTSGIVGGEHTWGDEIVQSGILGRYSYSVGQFHYETEGFRKNNDLKEDIYNAFVQMSLAPKTSIQAEFRSAESDKGDLTLRFFPNDFLPNLRDEQKTKSVRFGLHHAFSPQSDFLASLVYQNATSETQDRNFPVAVNFKTDSDSYSTELQHLFRSEFLNLVSGFGYFYINRRDVDTLKILIPPPMTSSEVTDGDVHHTNLYLYSRINYPKTVTLTLGGSADFFQGGIVDHNQFNPKLGLTWNPLPGTSFRGALFRTFKRTLINDQTLEPTQVAGFNQFFDDFEGTEAWHYGVAADQKLCANLYAGGGVSKRDLKVPFKLFLLPPAPPIPQIKKVDWDERLGRAYLYWTPHPWLALSAEYQYEEFSRDKEFTFNIEHVVTHRVPLGVGFYHPSGLSFRLKGTYINQRGKFEPQNAAPGAPSLAGEDQFWVVDAGLSYRLPKRYGIVTVGVKNLLDKSFRFQDTDPVSPTIQPRRFVYSKFTLTF